MNIPRRKFVKAGITASLFAGLPGKLASPTAAHKQLRTVRQLNPADPLAYYNKAAFAAYLNSDFRIVTNGRSETWLRLVLVEDFPIPEALRTSDECFRLLFAAPAETSLQQGTYDFDHAALGTFALFIVPGNPADGKRHYEAVFNRRFAGYVGPTVAPRLGADPAKRNKKRAAVELENRRLVSEPESRMEGSARPARRQKMMDW